MMDRIKVFPLVVLGVVVFIGVVLYLVAVKGRRPVPAPETAPPQQPRPVPQGTVEAPPPADDPGAKILEGADRAFKVGQFPTAVKSYKYFELRFAGTEIHERNLTHVWERLHTSNASSPKDQQDRDLPAYLESRRKLADEWKRLQPLLAAPPTPESRAGIEKFLHALPPEDGRRKIIDAWRERK